MLLQDIVTVKGGNAVLLPTSSKWRSLIYVHSVYTASSTVGNRTVKLQILDINNGLVGNWHVTPTVTAGMTAHLEFMQGTYREAAFDGNNTVQTPFPTGLVIPPKYTLQVIDGANISTLDTQVVNFGVKVDR